MHIKLFALCLAFFTNTLLLPAQQKQPTEFTKTGLLLIKLTNGFTTAFKGNTPDIYTGGLSANPQLTVIENSLRLGANAGFAYNDKKMSGLFGPMAALRLATFETKNYGSIANFQLIAEANWGTAKQQMAGLGLAAEILQKVQIGITAQRDYHLNNWWFQSFIGYQLNKRKKIVNEFD